jgi:acetyl esterase/lipase
MKFSLQYQFTAFYIRLKGIKKTFSRSSIDFRKIRKEDVHNPPNSFFKNASVNQFKIANTTITEIKKDSAETNLLLFVHGGAFIAGPNQLHWNVIKKLSKETKQTIWVCDYPKAPENDIFEISNNLDFVYQKALEKFESQNIILIGDSVGGTLVMALVQRAINYKWAIPQKLLLVCPVCDSTFQNPAINAIEEKDIMLSVKGVLSAKKMCAGRYDLDNTMISPINASFKNFPSTILYLAEYDITYADQQLLVNKLVNDSVSHKIYLGEGMPHIWPYLPFMPESKNALHHIVAEINKFNEPVILGTNA